jgi:uncharacterized protein YyaL (SSP411 family)
MALGADWTGVQYEKLLTGNAALVRDLLFALRRDPEPELAAALEGTARYLIRVLGRPGGGFYLAQTSDPASADGGDYWRDASREGRTPPPVDRLVLSGPNALAGAALIRAGLWLEDHELVAAGESALELVIARAHAPGRGMRHVIEPRPTPRAFLTTQADVALGLLDAFEGTGKARYLETAREVVDFALLNLKGDGGPALLDHLRESRPIGLLANPRRPMAPNVTLARAMIRLSAHGAGDRYREQARELLASYSGQLSLYRVHATTPALAVEEWIQTPVSVRIHGAPDSPGAARLRRAAMGASWPWTIVRVGDTDRGSVSAELSWKGTTETVKSAEALHESIRRLTGEEDGG